MLDKSVRRVRSKGVRILRKLIGHLEVEERSELVTQEISPPSEHVHPFWQSHRRFRHGPIQNKVVLLSVPKCGTLMVRNILAHFVPEAQAHFPFLDSLNVLKRDHPVHDSEARFYTGHVTYGVHAAVALRGARVLALVRDPVDYALSQAYFLLTAERRSAGDPLPAALHDNAFCHREVLPLVISGSRVQGKSYGALAQEFQLKAMAWVAGGASLVRYEDVKRHAASVESEDSRAFFEQLIGNFGIPLPADWADRVRAGASREISVTASERLDSAQTRQRYLTRSQFDYLQAMAPGLREALGYLAPPTFEGH